MNPETDFSIRTFSGGYDKNLTYLVTCSRTGTQVIIDAAIEINAISEYLRSDPIAILITHGHNDHTAYLNEYIQQYPNINVLGHPDSNIRESNPHFKKIEDNQGFIIGEMNFKGIHTPGHFFDSICYQLSPVLFTGDTIFIGRTGRIKGSKSNVEDLYRSVYDKILKMPKNMRIYPGHDYGDKPTMTLGENIKHSSLLRAKDLKDFRKRMIDYEKNRDVGS